ncbi:MAG: cytosine/adenosine deaminase-related metal-dependent hydrolase [Granulosicoccus sp.]|jgi:cytosine/adenosine deaminase-related metal-dependent hydrolase
MTENEMPGIDMPGNGTPGPVLMSARWVVGHEDGHYVLYENGEVVFEHGEITFIGHDFQGEVSRRVDCGQALIGPGFIDLDALADLDTTVLAFDNQPAWQKGRVWPADYMATPREMYSAEEIAWQKRYAFARLIRNGITTALPISSLFYREWAETRNEFAAAADDDLGLRVYLGPAYRSGNNVVRADGTLDQYFDEQRGLAGLADAECFCRDFEGTAGGLIRTMLAPDRIETCTPKLLRRSAAVARDHGVPIRLHCCQSLFEYEVVLRLHGMSPPQWLASLDFLSERAILPHLTVVSWVNGGTHQAPDLEIIRDSGASLAHW